MEEAVRLLDDGRAVDGLLHSEARDGEHRKPAVLDLGLAVERASTSPFGRRAAAAVARLQADEAAPRCAVALSKRSGRCQSLDGRRVLSLQMAQAGRPGALSFGRAADIRCVTGG